MPRKGSRVWTFSRIEMIGQKRQENLAWALYRLSPRLRPNGPRKPSPAQGLPWETRFITSCPEGAAEFRGVMRSGRIHRLRVRYAEKNSSRPLVDSTLAS